MESNKPNFLVGALVQFCSVFLAVILALALMERPSSPTPQPLDSVESQISALVASSKEIASSIERLELQIEQDLARLERAISTRVLVEPSNVQPGEDTAGDLPTQGSRESGQFAWLSVLRKEIGRLLVERGLSPYDDPKIAAMVRKANQALKDASAEWSEGNRSINESAKAGQITGKEGNALKNQIFSEYKLRCNEAFDQLAAELDAYLAGGE